MQQHCATFSANAFILGKGCKLCIQQGDVSKLTRLTASIILLNAIVQISNQLQRAQQSHQCGLHSDLALKEERPHAPPLPTLSSFFVHCRLIVWSQ